VVVGLIGVPLTDTASPRRFHTAWTHVVRGTIWDLALPDDAALVAVGSGISSGRRTEDLTGQLVVLDQQGQVLWSHDSKTGVGAVATSSDGSLVVSVIDDGAVAFNKKGEILWRHQIPSRIWRVAVDAAGSTIAAASRGRLDVLDESGKLRWSKEISGTVAGVGMPRRGSLIAVLSWAWSENLRKRQANVRGLISVFDDSGTLHWDHPLEFNAVCEDDIHLAVALSDDGSTIALGSGSPSGRLLVFHADGRLLWNDSTRDDVLNAAVSRDGSVIALGSSDFRLHVFDGQTGRSWTRGTGGDPAHFIAGDFALAVAPDGGLVAAGAGDGNMYVFNRMGELVFSEPVGAKLQSVEFGKNHPFLAAGSADGKIHAFESI
jgi:WD40 repeat protein